VARSGEPASLLVGGHVLIGRQFVPVGKEVRITPTETDGGVRVHAVLSLHTVTGAVGAQQITTQSTETTATLQTEGTLRIDLGNDPKDRHWVEIRVRKVK
jgi:hypothetical protein